MTLTLQTAPASEPVTVTLMKDHLHYDATDQDTRITTLIKVAREACEISTRRAFFTQTWKMTMPDFPGTSGAIEILRPPLQSVTSIQYYDTAGTLQTMDAADYQVDTNEEPGLVAPARTKTWPSVDDETLNSVEIVFVAGWSQTSDIPEEIVHAIKLLVGHWFEHLEAATLEGVVKQIPFAVKMLLNHWTMPIA